MHWHAGGPSERGTEGMEGICLVREDINNRVTAVEKELKLGTEG